MSGEARKSSASRVRFGDARSSDQSAPDGLTVFSATQGTCDTMTRLEYLFGGRSGCGSKNGVKKVRRRCVICEGTSSGCWVRASDVRLGGYRCGACDSHRKRHQGRDRPLKRENPRWYRFSVGDLRLLLRTVGADQVGRNGRSKYDLFSRLDEVMARMPLEELDTACARLGITRLQTGETRADLLDRVWSAQWVPGGGQGKAGEDNGVAPGLDVSKKPERSADQGEFEEREESSAPEGDDMEVMRREVEAAVNEEDLCRFMSRAGYVHHKSMSKEQLLEVIRYSTPTTRKNVWRLLKEYDVRFDSRLDTKEVLMGRLADVERSLDCVGVSEENGKGENGGDMNEEEEEEQMQAARDVSLVGQRVCVWWDGITRWFAGFVKLVIVRSGLVYVVYDDGDEQWEAFGIGSRTRWTLGKARVESERENDANVVGSEDLLSGGMARGEMARVKETGLLGGAAPAGAHLAIAGECVVENASHIPFSESSQSEKLSSAMSLEVPSFGAGVRLPPLPASLGQVEAGQCEGTRRPAEASSKYMNAVVQVLRKAGKCMRSCDIVDIMVSEQLLEIGEDRKAFQRRLLGHLSREIRDNGNRIYTRTGTGVYGLAEWMGCDDRVDGVLADAPAAEAPRGAASAEPEVEVEVAVPTPDCLPHQEQFANDLEDYGNPPTWSCKAVRGGAASLALQTPTAHEHVVDDQYAEGQPVSDDDDLFGYEKKWAIDLPDCVSVAPDAAADQACEWTTEVGDHHISACPLNLDASSEEVISRINLVCEFVEDCVINNQLPSIPLVSGSASRPAFTMESNPAIVRFSRMLVALDIIHENLVECTDSRITQRDLYYIARSRDASIKAPCMMQLIQDVSIMLNVPRFAMGIDCRSKGLVFGPITVPGVGSCMRPRGLPISGSVPEIIAIPSVDTRSVSTVIIVEKESVFQRLVKQAPAHPVLSTCVIITGCGYPDIGTRAFLFKLAAQDKSIPIVGLVDWNANGAHILSQYRYGSGRSLESQAFCVPCLRWLGLRSSMLERLVRDAPDASCFSDCTSRDLALARSMSARLHDYGNDGWMTEVQCMEYGLKADIESVYQMVEGGGKGFCDIIGELIDRGEYI